eukprot:3024351-Lingulodinium_polyedra.AAC.1
MDSGGHGADNHGQDSTLHRCVSCAAQALRPKRSMSLRKPMTTSSFAPQTMRLLSPNMCQSCKRPLRPPG